ncbi:MAG: hypothetical protein SF052_26165 [Bacteroidia bacterium]|nr:hypothetical protein [Bacteroidia bacterium]
MESINTKTNLTYSLVPRTQIEPEEIERMYFLMESNYDCVRRHQFEKDLQQKQWVGILKDTEGVIQGFTTFSVNPGGTGTSEYNIVFSGDTIISPPYWGSNELIKGGMHTGGRIVATDPQKKWYWLLISKGHRTYTYLPLFFHAYFPRPNDIDADNLFPILDRALNTLFGNYWKPQQGLIIFPTSMGQLKPELTASTWQKRNKPTVAYFLEKNPGFYLGHELACLAEISPDNLKGIALKYFTDGMNNPLSVE